MLKPIFTCFAGIAISFGVTAHPGHSIEDMGENSTGFSISVPFSKPELPSLIIKAIEGNVPAMELIKSDYMDKKPWLVFHYLHSLDQWSEYPVKAIDKSYFMMHLIKYKYPRSRSYWKESQEWNGIAIKKSNNLISPETVPIATPELSEINGKRTTMKLASPFIESAPSAMTNRHRMRSGFPPVGPDNRLMVICRFIQDRGATYHELAHSDAQAMIDETQSGMSLSQACLSNKLAENYWVNRALDFETRYGEELSRD